MLRDVREFINLLEEKGLLKRVNVELSPILEIPEVLRRVAGCGGPALLFERVKGYPGWRVAVNLFGTLERVRLALGVERLEEVGERVARLMARPSPTSLADKLRGLKDIVSLSSYMPKTVRRAEFEYEVWEGEKVDVLRLPVFKCWPRDGGRYLTFAPIYVPDPVNRVMNIGLYRLMVRGPRLLVVHWQLHKRGQHVQWAALERGVDRLPAAVVVGGPPAAMLVGVMPVPYPIDKLLFAGILGGKGIEVYKLPNGVLVPSTAEVVLEGYVDPNSLFEEGPFGDHYGYYDKPTRLFPGFYVERIWVRKDPIYVGTCVGKPLTEDAGIGKAVERIFLPLLKLLLPEIVDINLPAYGLFHGIAIVSIRKRYPGHAKKVMMALWGLSQLSLTKIIVVVDHDVNVHDIGQVMWAIAAHVDPQRDVVIVPNTHADELDPSTPIPGYGSKLGIDATRKLPEEYGGREWPEEVKQDPNVVEKIDRIWHLLDLNTSCHATCAGGVEP